MLLMHVVRQPNRTSRANTVDHLQVAVELVERQAEGARKAGRVGALPLQGCIEGLKVLQIMTSLA
jgi:hypothetical protein